MKIKEIRETGDTRRPPVRRVPQAPPETDAQLKEKIGGAKALERRKKRRIRNILMIIIPADIVILAALLMVQFAQMAGSYTINGTAYRYYAGQQTPLADGTRLSRNAEGVTEMKGSQLEGEMSSLPVYYEDRQTVVLPQPMVYYASGSVTAVRAECFTELDYLDNGTVTAVSGGRETSLTRGFMYDGQDTYLFLEPVTLEFNGYRLELGAMSYVTADYQNDVMVYNRADGTMTMEPPTGAVTAKAVSGDYTVSLLEDSLTLQDGTKVLLFTRPDLLDGLK